MNTKELVIGGFVLLLSALFWWHGGKLALYAIRTVIRVGKSWLGLGLVALMLSGWLAAGKVQATTQHWESRRVCGTRSLGNTAAGVIARKLGWDIGEWGSWRLWSLELCASFEFDMTEGVGQRDFYSVSPTTIEFRASWAAAPFWDAENCQTWQYRRKEDEHVAVVGKCHIKLYLLPLGSKFNFVIWSRDIYNAFFVGERAYQDFPLPYWIDPLNEEPLEYLPGSDSADG